MRATRLLSLVATALAVAIPSFAFTLEPISVTMGPVAPGNVVTFHVSSEEKDRVAIRFAVFARDLSPDGKEIDVPADDQFIVYPTRMLLDAGSQAAVKLQWRGSGPLDAERSYRFVAEQVPLDTGAPQSSGIKVMFRYVASLYVGTPGFVSSLAAAVKGATGPAGEPGYLVTIANSGGRHVVANNLFVTLDGGAVTLGAQDLGSLSGANYLARRSISLFVPRPGAVAGKVYEAKLDFQAEY